jgi:hypothetical protein
VAEGMPADSGDANALECGLDLLFQHGRQIEWLAPVLRKNSIWLPSDRDVGTCLFGFPSLENLRS